MTPNRLCIWLGLQIKQTSRSTKIHQVELYIDNSNIALNKESKTGINNKSWTDSSAITLINDGDLNTYHKATDNVNQVYYVQLDDNIKFNSLSTIILSLDKNTGMIDSIPSPSQLVLNDNSGTNYKISLLDSSFKISC